ncbi:glyoxalase [Nocardiopsis sp. CNR-923]|uniref:VOC family protein n=1 Tax=Nocardiopsis sp. CNR-923 TaxID=1904965 RepID=UPI000968DF68|nr:VOC family protein [Nocardiopsis sp. CNR-923]OLT27397.1 glyoxalase [Nocardiopsis sp. CNR-923]
MTVLDLLTTMKPGSSRRRREVKVPQICGLARVTLSVRDRDESVRFYRSVLGFKELRSEDENGTLRTACRHSCGFLLDLVQHKDNFKGKFDHRRCGLDRLVLRVDNLGELEAWEDRFTKLDVEHTPTSHDADGSTLVFYDPDGTELALFAPAEIDDDED